MSRPTVRYHRPPKRSLQVPVSPLRSTSRSPSPSRRIAVDNSNGLTIDDLVSEEPGSRTCRGNQGAQRRPSPSPTRQPSTRRSANFSSEDEVELDTWFPFGVSKQRAHSSLHQPVSTSLLRPHLSAVFLVLS
ncbi:hypothetical protein ACHWQZ_G012534 [Mnemiopsis leidyi]